MVPAGIVGLPGVTAIDASAGAVTVRVVELVTDPKAAWIEAFP